MLSKGRGTRRISPRTAREASPKGNRSHDAPPPCGSDVAARVLPAQTRDGGARPDAHLLRLHRRGPGVQGEEGCRLRLSRFHDARKENALLQGGAAAQPQAGARGLSGGRLDRPGRGGRDSARGRQARRLCRRDEEASAGADAEEVAGRREGPPGDHGCRRPEGRRIPRHRGYGRRDRRVRRHRNDPAQSRRELRADGNVRRDHPPPQPVRFPQGLGESVPGSGAAAVREARGGTPDPGLPRRPPRRAHLPDRRDRHLRLHRVQQALPLRRRGGRGGLPCHGPRLPRLPRPRAILRRGLHPPQRRRGRAAPARFLPLLLRLRPGKGDEFPPRRPAHRGRRPGCRRTDGRAVFRSGLLLRSPSPEKDAGPRGRPDGNGQERLRQGPRAPDRGRHCPDGRRPEGHAPDPLLGAPLRGVRPGDLLGGDIAPDLRKGPRDRPAKTRIHRGRHPRRLLQEPGRALARLRGRARDRRGGLPGGVHLSRGHRRDPAPVAGIAGR